MRSNICAILALAIGSILFQSCGKVVTTAHEKHEENLFEVTSYSFSEDYKTMNINTVMSKNLEGLTIDDFRKMHIRITEDSDRTLFLTFPMQPKLKELYNTAARQAFEAGIQVSVLVDLTLRQDAVDAERNAVLQLRSVFHNNNMQLFFMDSEGVSEAYEASDYIMNNYFVSLRSSSGSNKHLYESMLKHTASFKDPLARTVFIILTDGHTYSDGRPIDPNHFQNQEKLQKRCAMFPDNSELICISFSDERDEDDASDFLRNLCERSHGVFQEKFDWNAVKREIFNNFGINYIDCTMVLEYPDQKVFNGKKTLDIDCIYQDSVITGTIMSYRLGSFIRPIIVNGRSSHQTLIAGTLLALFVALLVYVVSQIMIPRILDVQFRRKYVRTYEKENTSVNGIMVESSCYYCKAPFVPGDRIVAKCRHVMHKSCWDENGFHCPEYGRHCTDGYHYFNPDNLLDTQNSSYHLKWILAAILAGYVAWSGIIIKEHRSAVTYIFDYIQLILGDSVMSSNHELMQELILGNMNQFPTIGFWIGLVLILGLALMSVHRNKPLLIALDIALRVLVGTVLCFGVFFVCNLATILFDLGEYSFIIDWVPWVMSGLIIMFSVTFRSRIRVNRYWVLGTVLVGVVTMMAWNLFFANYGKDYRVHTLFSLMLFSVGLSMSIAKGNPRSERYFFFVSGATKEMEIALYKWFSANSNRTVTIGKSVDCDIVMSWDIAGDIAPVHVSIIQKAFGIYVKPIENGVLINGKPAKVGNKIRIYHGNTITIGKTTFKLIEKDI